MTTWDLLSIVAIAGGCALLVGVLGAVVLRLLRRRSIVLQIAVVAVGAVAATLSGITGVASAMFLSAHDFRVVAYVCAVSGVVGTALSLVLSRRIVRSSAELTTATRLLGEGHKNEITMLADRHYGSEFTELAGELSTASAKLYRSRECERTMEGSRRELIAWISHDLRTPITGLLTMTEALANGTVVDAAAVYRQLHLELDRVAGMVDDLIELSHTQVQTPRQSQQHTNLHHLVNEAIAAIEPIAGARGINIGYPQVSDIAVQLDPRQMTGALSNVLLNAIRHTPTEGSVAVSLHVMGSEHVCVAITDGCDSMPHDGLDNVFTTAWRGEAATPNSSSSAGLPQATLLTSPRGMKGMAAVKDIVEAADGEIVVTHAASGHRFDITLPLAQ